VRRDHASEEVTDGIPLGVAVNVVPEILLVSTSRCGAGGNIGRFGSELDSSRTSIAKTFGGNPTVRERSSVHQSTESSRRAVSVWRLRLGCHASFSDTLHMD
jgi:hypothetical protein